MPSAMLELDREHGGFGRYLESLGSYDETVKALRGEFRFVGETGAYIFLWGAGQPVPKHDEWSATHQRAS